MPAIVAVIVLFSGCFATDLEAATVLDSVIAILNPEFSQGIMTQTIQTTTGDTRVLEYEVFSGFFGEYSLMRYRQPTKVRNNALLTTDFSDNIWMYNQRTKRTRKIASHARKNKFEGSDFSYEDMSTGNSWQKDYHPTIGDDKKIEKIPCHQLILNRVNKEVSYSKIVCWIRQQDFYPVQVDYYNDKQILQKTLLLEDIRAVDGHPTAFKMTMKNHQDRTQTIMEYLELTYDISFDREFFSDRNLKK